MAFIEVGIGGQVPLRIALDDQRPESAYVVDLEDGTSAETSLIR